jgi:adenylate cyclase
MELAESSVRLDPRSSFAYSILAYLQVMQGRYEDAHEAIRHAVELNPNDMGARGVQGICHLVVGQHREAIELLSMAVQRGNSDPRYQWGATMAFSQYLLGQYDAALSWAREALYLNPDHLQVLALRPAALARLNRTEEAAKARDALLDHYPDFTIKGHLRNFRWKNETDIAHYREGLLKAGVPYGTIALVKRAADT